MSVWTPRAACRTYEFMRPGHVDKTIDGIRVQGYSLAGEETVVALPELNVCFDAGRAPAEIIPIDNLCVTHGHMDHAAGMAYYLSQRGFVGNAPGRIIVHRRLARHVQALMGVWADLEGHHSPGLIEGVTGGDEIQIRRDLRVRAFDVVHSEGALGFVLVEKRHKLKAEYAGHTGPQLVELKKRGIEIQHNIEVPLVAYCGDTAVGAFLDREDVRTARIILLECTFFAAEHVSRARKGRHIHVRDLPPVLRRINCPNVVLTHFTRRTALREAKEIVRRTISPEDAGRVSILMERPPRERRALRTTSVHEGARGR